MRQGPKVIVKDSGHIDGALDILEGFFYESYGLFSVRTSENGAQNVGVPTLPTVQRVVARPTLPSCPKYRILPHCKRSRVETICRQFRVHTR